MHWVIFVPGFGGSHLFRRALGGDREEQIWLREIDVGWSGIEALDPTDDNGIPKPEVVTAGQPLFEVYSPFYQFLARIGVPSWNWGYDWRLDIATNAARLAADINADANSNAEYTIVAHSMGGLIAAGALNRLNDAAIPKVKRLITCGTPWHGTYRALQLLTGQHETVEKIVFLNSILSRKTTFQWRRDTIRTVAAWPGVFDLLPMPELLTKYPPGEGQDFLGQWVWGQVNPWFRAQMHADAVARRPIHFAFPDTIQHYCMRGTGRRTMGPSPTVYDGEVSHWPEALFGDGTVPEFSSTPPTIFNANRMDFDADHEQFMANFDVQLVIGRLLGVI